MRGHKADRCWQKERSKRDWEKGEKVDLKERNGPKENGQTLVTRGTVLGTIHIGTEKTYGLNLFHISVQSI